MNKKPRNCHKAAVKAVAGSETPAARPWDYRLSLLKGRLYVNGVETDFFVDAIERTGQVIDPGNPFRLAEVCFQAGWQAAESEREETRAGKGKP